jgi:hypothetical protein
MAIELTQGQATVIGIILEIIGFLVMFILTRPVLERSSFASTLNRERVLVLKRPTVFHVGVGIVVIGLVVQIIALYLPNG